MKTICIEAFVFTKLMTLSGQEDEEDVQWGWVQHNSMQVVEQQSLYLYTYSITLNEELDLIYLNAVFCSYSAMRTTATSVWKSISFKEHAARRGGAGCQKDVNHLLYVIEDHSYTQRYSTNQETVLYPAAQHCTVEELNSVKAGGDLGTGVVLGQERSALKEKKKKQRTPPFLNSDGKLPQKLSHISP